MKVLIDGRVLTNKQTGLGRYAENLIKSYISTFGKSNISVLVRKNFTKRIEGVQYIETSLNPISLIHFLVLPFFLRKISFDIFHASFYSGVPGKKRNTFYAITVHDVIYRKVKRYFHKNWLLNFLAVKYFDILVWMSVRPADFRISVSETTKDDLKSGFGFPSVVIPEGFNTIKPSDNSKKVESFFAGFGLSKNEYFLYVGNLKLHKNVEFLVRAFLKAKTDKYLVLCGYYKDIPEYLMVSDRIKFTGFVEDELLPHLYLNAAAFVFPSQYEGFGFPVLEALDYRCLVFSSRCGALKEFSEEFIYFFEIDQEAELSGLLENCDSLPPKNTDITSLRSYYNWESAMEKMQEILRSAYQDWKKS